MEAISDAEKALHEIQKKTFRILKDEGILASLKQIFPRSYNFIDLHPSPVRRVDLDTELIERECLSGKYYEHQAYFVDESHVLISSRETGEYGWGAEERLGAFADIWVFHNKELVLHIERCFKTDESRLDWKIKVGAYKEIKKAKLDESWMNALKNIVSAIERTDELEESRSAEEAKEQLKDFDLGCFS